MSLSLWLVWHTTAVLALVPKIKHTAIVAVADLRALLLQASVLPATATTGADSAPVLAAPLLGQRLSSAPTFAILTNEERKKLIELDAAVAPKTRHQRLERINNYYGNTSQDEWGESSKLPRPPKLLAARTPMRSCSRSPDGSGPQ